MTDIYKRYESELRYFWKQYGLPGGLDLDALARHLAVVIDPLFMPTAKYKRPKCEIRFEYRPASKISLTFEWFIALVSFDTRNPGTCHVEQLLSQVASKLQNRLKHESESISAPGGTYSEHRPSKLDKDAKWGMFEGGRMTGNHRRNH